MTQTTRGSLTAYGLCRCCGSAIRGRRARSRSTPRGTGSDAGAANENVRSDRAKRAGDRGDHTTQARTPRAYSGPDGIRKRQREGENARRPGDLRLRERAAAASALARTMVAPTGAPATTTTTRPRRHGRWRNGAHCDRGGSAGGHCNRCDSDGGTAADDDRDDGRQRYLSSPRATRPR